MQEHLVDSPPADPRFADDLLLGSPFLKNTAADLAPLSDFSIHKGLLDGSSLKDAQIDNEAFPDLRGEGRTVGVASAAMGSVAPIKACPRRRQLTPKAVNATAFLRSHQ